MELFIMRRLIVLGISGSIGTQTCDIIKRYPRSFSLVGFSLGNKVDLIDKLLEQFPSVKAICVKKYEDFEIFQTKYPHIKFMWGDEGLLSLLDAVKCDMVVNALVGFVGFVPSLKTIEKGIDLALANKESLVVGGELINKELQKSSSHLYPIDSEHVALAKCLKGQKKVKRLILTASGGSFRDLNRDQLQDVKVADALKHPSWKMGNKITIDCATMMNKGFEIIEAHYLFNFPVERISVLLHDESHIHSMIEFEDGSYLADIGPADMRIPISYALFKGKRVSNDLPRFNLDDYLTFHFRKFSIERYPCVSYALEALKTGGTMLAVLNAANEEAVNAFLEEKISFLDIEKIIREVMNRHNVIKNPALEDILKANTWSRNEAQKIIKEGN